MQDSAVLFWTALMQGTACSSTWHRSGRFASSSAVGVRVAQLCCRDARGRARLNAAGKNQWNRSVLLWCVNPVICWAFFWTRRRIWSGCVLRWVVPWSEQVLISRWMDRHACIAFFLPFYKAAFAAADCFLCSLAKTSLWVICKWMNEVCRKFDFLLWFYELKNLVPPFHLQMLIVSSWVP